MNRSGLHQLIEDPARLLDLPVEELEKLRDAYPWFSAAQVLLAKAYQVTDDHRFTDQLHQAALFTGNRRSLHQFIQTDFSSPAPTEHTDIQEIATQQSAPHNDPVVDPQALAEADVLSEPEPISPDQPELEDSDQTEDKLFFELFREPVASDVPADADRTRLEEMARQIVEEDHVVREIAPVFRPAFDPLPTTTESEVPEISDEQDDTEQSIPTENSETRIEQVETIDVASLDELDRAILAQAVSSSISIEVGRAANVDEDVEDVPPAIASDRVAVDEESNDPYTQWLNRRARQLHYLEETEGSGSPDSPAQLKETDENIKPAPMPQPRAALRPEDPKVRQQSLIERFMKAEPRITPAKSAEYDTVNIAKESLEEDFTLVTETMAILLARQGKLEKARKVYRRLMELYPEKSVYFAAQLKNLNVPKKT